MKDKYYEFTSLILMSILLVFGGIVLLVGKNVTYEFLVSIIILVLFMNAFRDFVKYIFGNSSTDEAKTFLSCLFHLLICLFLAFFHRLVLGFFPFVFGIYLVIVGIAQIVMCILEIRSGDVIRVRHIIVVLVCFSVGLPILASPIDNLNSFLIYFSVYIILLGFSMFYEAIGRVLSKKLKNKLKRRIRITLPKVIEAIIPYSVMLEINRNLSFDKKPVYSFDKGNEKADLHILIHTSNRGFNKMGHIDLCLDGVVISFGNYDEGSRIFKETFGDGVLFTTRKMEAYINFCIDHSKKTIFDFGISLSDIQKKVIRKRIDEIMKKTYRWNYKDDKKYCNGNSYAAKLFKKTKAKFYKFSKGKYRTYFVLWTNCCFLVDDVVGKCGMDVVSINGIITPGTYYDFLNRELRLKSSNVVSKDIYNSSRRAKKRFIFKK